MMDWAPSDTCASYFCKSTLDWERKVLQKPGITAFLDSTPCQSHSGSVVEGEERTQRKRTREEVHSHGSAEVHSVASRPSAELRGIAHAEAAAGNPAHKTIFRRQQVECKVESEAVESSEDGFRWRQYGQKALLNSPYTRVYYRCTRKDLSCPAKKIVDRIKCKSKSSSSRVVYQGEHCHSAPSRAPPTKVLIVSTQETLSQGTSSASAATSSALSPGQDSSPNTLAEKAAQDVATEVPDEVPTSLAEDMAPTLQVDNLKSSFLPAFGSMSEIIPLLFSPGDSIFRASQDPCLSDLLVQSPSLLRSSEKRTCVSPNTSDTGPWGNSGLGCAYPSSEDWDAQCPPLIDSDLENAPPSSPTVQQQDDPPICPLAAYSAAAEKVGQNKAEMTSAPKLWSAEFNVLSLIECFKDEHEDDCINNSISNFAAQSDDLSGAASIRCSPVESFVSDNSCFGSYAALCRALSLT